MDETAVGEDGTAPRGNGVGQRLRAAREAAGLSLADVGARTRVPLRHLEAIEHGAYHALPSPTYAVGFARAYARAVGMDEVAVAADVRAGLADVPRAPEYEPYEIADPARVPSRGLAIVAAGAALALLILAGLWFGTDLLRGRIGSQMASEPAATPSAAATVAAAPATPPPAPAPTGGQVRLTATGRVWLRVGDADGKTLFENTLNTGDHYDVPTDARAPVLAIGRPDKVSVTLDGRPVPPLGDGSHAIKDVAIGGAAVAARLAATPATAIVPAPLSSASATTVPGTVASVPPAIAVPRSRPTRPASRPRSRPVLSETQRANLEASPPPAAVGGTTP